MWLIVSRCTSNFECAPQDSTKKYAVERYNFNIFIVCAGINNPNGLHPFEFWDYSMVLSDPQIELLAKTLGVSAPSNEALATDFQKTFPRAFGDLMTNSLGEPLAMYEALETRPCAWNMFLRRR